VVTPDRFGETADGSSLYPTEGYCLRLDSSSPLSMLKFAMFFCKNIVFTACFLLVNLLVKIYRVSRKISYNRNPVKFFKVCCVHIDIVDTQDVKCFDVATNHVGRDIKAWYVLRHAIDVAKASMSYPRNRKVLIGFIMSHRNMDIIINKSKKVQNFAERLIKSTVGGISESFDNRWGKSLGPGCVWEEKKCKVKTVYLPALLSTCLVVWHYIPLLHMVL
jgi:hypothetical protein